MGGVPTQVEEMEEVGDLTLATVPRGTRGLCAEVVVVVGVVLPPT